MTDQSLKEIHEHIMMILQNEKPPYILNTYINHNKRKIIIAYIENELQKTKKFIDDYMKNVIQDKKVLALQARQNPVHLGNVLDLCHREISVIKSCSKTDIKSGSLTCFARDQYQRCFLVTAKHIFKENRESGIYFSGGLLHFLDRDKCHHFYPWNICYGIYNCCKLPSRMNSRVEIKYWVDISLLLLPNCELEEMDEIHVFKGDIDDEYDEDDYEGEPLPAVEKYGSQTGLTYGVVIVSNYTYKRCNGMFVVANAEKVHGKMVIKHEKPFADILESGALVKLISFDTDANSVKKQGLGIVWKSFVDFTDIENNEKYDFVTVCIRLDKCLDALNKKWKLDLQLYETLLCKNIKNTMINKKHKRTISQ